MMFGRTHKLLGKTVFKNIIRVAVIATLFALYLFLSIRLSGTSCFFKATVGVPCPGCGMTRAFLALLRFDLKSAFYYHPLFFMVPVAAGIFIYKYVRYGNQRKPLFDVFAAILIVLFVGVYIIRMIMMFPHTDPFLYNSEALFPREIKFITSVMKHLFY